MKDSLLPLSVGMNAPDFSLEDQSGHIRSLTEFIQKNDYVLVYFYPKALTSGCTLQACALRDAKVELRRLNIAVLGISADPVQKLARFAEKEKLNFLLLSDVNHVVCKNYGVWIQKSMYGKQYMGIQRVSFLIGKSGEIVHIIDKVTPKNHLETILKYFEK